MQAPTHILAGVIIKKLFDWKQHRALAFVIVAVTSIFFHGIFDKLAKMTYHRPDADFNDPFWVGYHICVLLTTIVFLYLYWSEFKWGIIFSLLPDVDWIFIHVQEIFSIEIPFYEIPHLHNALNYFLDNVFSFSHLQQLPDFRYFYWAVIPEITFIGILLLFIRFLMNRRRNVHF